MGKGKPGAVYEKFIDGRMRIMGSGADTEWDVVMDHLKIERPKGWVPDNGALAKQEGGSHYKDMKIQPVEFITANNLGFLEGNVVKYICRHHAKNGAEDIKKAIHYCELLLQTKYGD